MKKYSEAKLADVFSRHCSWHFWISAFQKCSCYQQYNSLPRVKGDYRLESELGFCEKFENEPPQYERRKENSNFVILPAPSLPGTRNLNSISFARNVFFGELSMHPLSSCNPTNKISRVLQRWAYTAFIKKCETTHSPTITLRECSN